MRITAGAAADSGDRITEAFAREERAGLAYALWGRLAVLAALAAYVLIALPIERSLTYLGVIALFMALGAVPHLLRRWGFASVAWTAAFTLLDVILLTYLLVVPAPLFAAELTPQMNLRLPNFLYLGVFLVGMALSYSPAIVIWTGAATIAAWAAGVLWVAALPGSLALSSVDILDRGAGGSSSVIEVLLDARYVSLTKFYNQLIFLALVTLILAITVWRSRKLVRRQVAAEAARANLSRYFSPNLVDELAAAGSDVERVSTHKVAVLFADMVGFTAHAETLEPRQVIALLRDFHGRLARTVFAHGGTLDKYIGDAVMAHFGTPLPRGGDATRALACAVAMVRAIAGWNAERAARGEAPLGVGVGLHYGEVVAGNIGDARRLEYTVLGDTVNVASRLEALTREVKRPLVVSDALIEAVRAEGAEEGEALVRPFVRDRERAVRGRSAPVPVWVLNEASAAGGSNRVG